MSASRCKVNFSSGYLEEAEAGRLVLTGDDRPMSYITDATVMEMNDCLFRTAAANNMAYLNTLSFRKDVIWSLTLALQDWCKALPKEYDKCRLFGGDMLKTEMLECIYDAFGKDDNHSFYMHTSRLDILNDITDKEIKRPDNVYIYARADTNSDIIQMHDFPMLYITNKPGHLIDLEFFPGANTDATISLGEKNEDQLRTRAPWFGSL